MSLADSIGLVRDILVVLALLASSGFAIFVYLQFAPVIALRIQPSWSGDTTQWVILRFEVENKSRVRIRKQVIHLQVLEHTISEGGSLSEWVPFEEKAIKPSEQPVQWREPVEIFQSTRAIDPGEILAVERLHYCPPNTVLHVGLQVRAKFGLWGRIATQVRGWHQQWTTTKIVTR